MASTQHTPTELEAAGDLVLPAADELAGRFPLTPNAHPATPEEYNEIMSTLAFGKKFTDHMAHMRWTREGGLGTTAGRHPLRPARADPRRLRLPLLPVRVRGHQGLQARGWLRVDLPPRLQCRAA